MKQLIKRRFALTDQGAKDLIKSSVASFFSYIINMLPAIVLLFFLEDILLAQSKSETIYVVLSVISLILLYIVLSIEYNALYNATFRESENLRIDIARTLSKLPLSYFSKHDLSDLAQTIMTDVAAIEHALSHAIAKTIGFVVFFALIAIMLIGGNWILGLAVVVPIFINFALVILSKKLQVTNQGKYYIKLRKNSESFQEAIELQQEIKSFGLTGELEKRLNKEMEEGEKIHIKSEISTAVVMNLSGLVLYISLLGVILIGLHLLIKGEINILYFIGYLLAAMKLKDGTEGISLNFAELFYIDSMIQRIKEIRETKIQQGKDVQLSKFDIELENVSFSYDKDTPLLEDVSFVAEQNKVTALVGKSGCGKTSILRLVSRLYDYDKGSIKISGKDIKEISTKDLFDKVSIVFQDVTLFNASVMENIRIGNVRATDEEVKKAGALANCQDFIEELPKGYETLIGENGASLSGGERQRISIARAFLKNAPIIILDEIAASLDVDNEKKIQESLNKLTKNKTVIIISHRLKSIENVDKIVVIENGKVEATGNHRELLKTCKTYCNLIEKSKLAEEFKY